MDIYLFIYLLLVQSGKQTGRHSADSISPVWRPAKRFYWVTKHLHLIKAFGVNRLDNSRVDDDSCRKAWGSYNQMVNCISAQLWDYTIQRYTMWPKVWGHLIITAHICFSTIPISFISLSVTINLHIFVFFILGKEFVLIHPQEDVQEGHLGKTLCLFCVQLHCHSWTCLSFIVPVKSDAL